jgi:hypothetical protein
MLLQRAGPAGTAAIEACPAPFHPHPRRRRSMATNATPPLSPQPACPNWACARPRPPVYRRKRTCTRSTQLDNSLPKCALISDSRMCLTTHQELSRQGVGLASLEYPYTPCRTKCEPEPVGWARTMQQASGVTSYTAAAPVEDRGRREVAPVEDRSLRTMQDFEGACSRRHGPTAERQELRLGELGSVHYWTGTTCRAASLACSYWSEKRDVRLSRLDRVEACGDNWKLGWTGSRPRCAVVGVYD